jgi:hypothetical protein
MAFTPKALPASGSSTLHTGVIQVGGFTFFNGSGGASVITIYDNTAASGVIIYEESVATLTSTAVSFKFPITAKLGVTVNLSAGTATGSVWMD